MFLIAEVEDKIKTAPDQFGRDAAEVSGNHSPHPIVLSKPFLSIYYATNVVPY